MVGISGTAMTRMARAVVLVTIRIVMPMNATVVMTAMGVVMTVGVVMTAMGVVMTVGVWMTASAVTVTSGGVVIHEEHE